MEDRMKEYCENCGEELTEEELEYGNGKWCFDCDLPERSSF